MRCYLKVAADDDAVAVVMAGDSSTTAQQSSYSLSAIVGAERRRRWGGAVLADGAGDCAAELVHRHRLGQMLDEARPAACFEVLGKDVAADGNESLVCVHPRASVVRSSAVSVGGAFGRGVS